MNVNFYSYGNIVRILATGSDGLSDGLMVDVNIDGRCILSVFDGESKFDADFIRSFLNILRESTVGFRLLGDSDGDASLRARAVNVLGLNQSESPKIPRLLSCLGF